MSGRGADTLPPNTIEQLDNMIRLAGSIALLTPVFVLVVGLLLVRRD